MRFKGRSITDITILVIAGFFLANLYFFPQLEDHLALVKYFPLSDGTIYGTSQGEWWRYFTVALVHAGWIHLVMNMLAFHQLGTVLEQFLGRYKYLALMFTSLLGASFVSNYFAAPYQSAVGASGMIYGLFGAFVVVSKRVGADTRSIYVTIAINLGLTFSIPGIDWHAHVGGLIVGALVTYLLTFNGPQKRLRNI